MKDYITRLVIRRLIRKTQLFKHSPTYCDLLGMAKEYLLSNHICFNIHAGSFGKEIYPVSGAVLAGAHQVGDFNVE